MMTSGPGTLPYEQNIQQLKGLGSAFRNLGYKDSSGNQQLGTKQLQRLASAAASLPNPAVTDYNPMATALRQARIQRATMTPVELAQEKVALGNASQNLQDQQVQMPGIFRGGQGFPKAPSQWKAAPFTAAPAAARPSALGAGGAKPSRTPGRSGGGGGSKGGGGDRSGEFGKPMTNQLVPKFGAATGANPDYKPGDNKASGGGLGGSSGLTGSSLRYGSTPTPTSHAAYAAKGPTLGQRQQSQLAAFDTKSGVSYGQTANPMGGKTAELEAKGDARRANDAASIKGLNKGKGKGKGK